MQLPAAADLSATPSSSPSSSPTSAATSSTSSPSPPFFSPSQDSSPRSSHPQGGSDEVAAPTAPLPSPAALPATARQRRRRQRGGGGGEEEASEASDAAAASEAASPSPLSPSWAAASPLLSSEVFSAAYSSASPSTGPSLAASPTPQPLPPSMPPSPHSTQPPSSSALSPSSSPTLTASVSSSSSSSSSPPSPSSRPAQALLLSQVRSLDAEYPGSLEVDLSHNGLCALCPLHLFARLLVLDLSYNQLSATCLPHLSSLTSLTFLSLAYNLINSLDLFPPLPALTSLDLSCNLIPSSSLARRLHQPLRRCCPHLHALAMQGNPFCLSQPGYRQRLLEDARTSHSLPALRWLDGLPTTAEGQLQRESQAWEEEEKEAEEEVVEWGEWQREEREERQRKLHSVEGMRDASEGKVAALEEWRTPREGRRHRTRTSTARGPHGTERKVERSAKRGRSVDEAEEVEEAGEKKYSDGLPLAGPLSSSPRSLIPSSASAAPLSFSGRELRRSAAPSPVKPGRQPPPVADASAGRQAQARLQEVAVSPRLGERFARGPPLPSISSSSAGQGAEQQPPPLAVDAPLPLILGAAASSGAAAALRREVSALHELLQQQGEALSEATSVDAKGLAVWRQAMQRLLMRQREAEELRQRAQAELRQAQGRATREAQQNGRHVEALTTQLQQQRRLMQAMEEELGQARVEQGRLHHQMEATQHSARQQSRRAVEALLSSAVPTAVTAGWPALGSVERGLAELSARLHFATQRLRMLAALQGKGGAGGASGDTASLTHLFPQPQASGRAVRAVEAAGAGAELMPSAVVHRELQRLRADRALLLTREEAAARAPRADGERLRELQQRSEELAGQLQKAREEAERVQAEAEQLRAALDRQSAERSEEVERVRAEAEASSAERVESSSAEVRRVREENASLQRQSVALSVQVRALQKEAGRAQTQLREADEQRWRAHEEQLHSLQQRLERSEREKEELRQRWRQTLPSTIARHSTRTHQHHHTATSAAPALHHALHSTTLSREDAATGAKGSLGSAPMQSAAATAAADGRAAQLIASPPSSTAATLALHARLQSLADLSKQLLDVDLDD